MRWTKPKHLDQRVVRKFLLLPNRIGTEVRWLEWATVRQEYDRLWPPMWKDIQFIDEDKE